MMRSRGYLLLEAMFAGALLGAAMAIAIALVAHGRSSVSLAANRSSAAALARAKADELASGAACVATQALVAIGTDYPGFKWSWSSANAASMASSTPAITTETVCHASVTVEYPCPPRSREDLSDGSPTNGRAQLVAERMWHP